MGYKPVWRHRDSNVMLPPVKKASTKRGNLTPDGAGLLHLMWAQGYRTNDIAYVLSLCGTSVMRRVKTVNVLQATMRDQRKKNAARRVERMKAKKTHVVRRIKFLLKPQYKNHQQVNGSTRKLSRVLRNEAAAKGQSTRGLSKSSINRLIRDGHKAGLHEIKVSVRQKGPPWTEAHIKAREAFARNHTHLDVENVLFSDEKMWSCDQRGRMHYYTVHEGEQLPLKATLGSAYSMKLHVWGVIGVGVKKLFILPPGMVNAEAYHWTLSHRLKLRTDAALRGKIFQQDNAPAHTAKKVKAYLDSGGGKWIKDWPSKSPDLSPIETLWAIAAREAEKDAPTTEGELRAAILRAWDAIPQATVDRLVRGFHDRRRHIVEHGGHVKAHR
jgi:hypothetical protein